MAIKKIVVALLDDDKTLPTMHDWGHRFEWEHVEEVHFLHIVKKIITTLEFGIVEMPDEQTYQQMRPTYERFLKNEAEKILPANFTGKVFYHVKKEFDPKEETETFLETINADLLVVCPQHRSALEAFFHRSFTDFMVNHSPCDIYIAKPDHTIQL